MNVNTSGIQQPLNKRVIIYYYYFSPACDLLQELYFWGTSQSYCLVIICQW